MKRFNDPLKRVRIASPCNADWDQMIGDERVRFCGQCTLHVYNLSNMSRRNAEELIEHNEGRLCVRYYRRADGSVITKDCPVGLKAIRRKMSYLVRAVVSVVLSFLAGIGLSRLISQEGISAMGLSGPVMGTTMTTLGKPQVLMGDIASPPLTDPARSPITMGKMALKPLSVKNQRQIGKRD